MNVMGTHTTHTKRNKQDETNHDWNKTKQTEHSIANRNKAEHQHNSKMIMTREI